MNKNGFTLIEVLVALVIFAIVSVTLVYRTGESVRAIQYLERKTMAAWAAENVISQYRYAEEWPAIGQKEQLVEMVDMEWNVKTDVTSTPNENLRKIIVDVGYKNAAGDVRNIYTLTSFIGKF